MMNVTARLLSEMWQAAREILTGRPLLPEGEEVSDFTCGMCGGRNGRRLYLRRIPASRGRTLARCEECSLVATYPMPAEEEIPAFYDDYYGEENAKFGAITEFFVFLFRIARLRAIRQMCPAGSRVLDIGCARGLFLHLIEKRGHEAHGTELSEESARTAKRRIGEDRIRVGPLARCRFTDGYFHAVTAWQVFEHLRDPGATLDECRRILVPGGALLLSVPNVESWQARFSKEDWFHLDVPRHLYHFGERSLSRMLDEHGFDVVGVSHYSLEQNPFGLLQSALHRLGFPHMGLYNLLRGPKEPAIGRGSRFLRYGLYLGAFPFAAGMSYLFSFLGSGATFTVYARARMDRPNLHALP